MNSHREAMSPEDLLEKMQDEEVHYRDLVNEAIDEINESLEFNAGLLYRQAVMREGELNLKVTFCADDLELIRRVTEIYRSAGWTKVIYDYDQEQFEFFKEFADASNE